MTQAPDPPPLPVGSALGPVIVGVERARGSCHIVYRGWDRSAGRSVWWIEHLPRRETPIAPLLLPGWMTGDIRWLAKGGQYFELRPRHEEKRVDPKTFGVPPPPVLVRALLGWTARPRVTGALLLAGIAGVLALLAAGN